MDELRHWRLCDELTVIQAALLIAGYDPAESQDFVETWRPDQRPTGYDAAKAALHNAILNGKLPAKTVEAIITNEIHDSFGNVSNVEYVKLGHPDIAKTIIAVDDIKRFISAKGFRDGFFFDGESAEESCTEKSNRYYAPKLAAAIRAWTEVTQNPSRLNGKTPKRALEIWLKEHAAEYGLVNRDGKINQQGIEEICKVANWKPEGGATRTAQKLETSKNNSVNFDLDYDDPYKE